MYDAEFSKLNKKDKYTRIVVYNNSNIKADAYFIIQIEDKYLDNYSIFTLQQKIALALKSDNDFNILLQIGEHKKIPIQSIENISDLNLRRNVLSQLYPILIFTQKTIIPKFNTNLHDFTSVLETVVDNSYLLSSRSSNTMNQLYEFGRLQPNYVAILYLRTNTRGTTTLEVRTNDRLKSELGAGYEAAYENGKAVKRSSDGVIYDFDRYKIFEYLSTQNITTEDVIYLYNLDWFDGMIGTIWNLEKFEYTYWAARMIMMEEIKTLRQNVNDANFFTRSYHSGLLEAKQNEYNNLLKLYLRACTNGYDIAEAFGLIPKNVSGFVDATYPSANLNIINDWIDLPIGGGAIVVDGVGHGHPEWKGTEGKFLQNVLSPEYELFMKQYLNGIEDINTFDNNYNKSITDTYVNPEDNETHGINTIFSKWNHKYIIEWGPENSARHDHATSLIKKLGDGISSEELNELNGILDSSTYLDQSKFLLRDDNDSHEINKVLSPNSSLSDINDKMVNLDNNILGSIAHILSKSIIHTVPSLQGAGINITQPLYSSTGSYLYIDNYADVCTIVLSYHEGAWVLADRIVNNKKEFIIKSEYNGQAGRPRDTNEDRIFTSLHRGGAFIVFSDGIGEFMSVESIIDTFNRSNGDIDLFRQLLHIEIEIKRGMKIGDNNDRSVTERMASKSLDWKFIGTKKWNINSESGYDDISVVVGYVKPYEIVMNTNNISSAYKNKSSIASTSEASSSAASSSVVSSSEASSSAASSSAASSSKESISVESFFGDSIDHLNSLPELDRAVKISEGALDSLYLSQSELSKYISVDKNDNVRQKREDLIEMLWNRNNQLRAGMLNSMIDIDIVIHPVLSSTGIFYNNNNYLYDVFDLTTNPTSVKCDDNSCEFEVDGKLYTVLPAKPSDDWYASERGVSAYATNRNGVYMCDDGLSENIQKKFVISSFTDGNGVSLFSQLAATLANKSVIELLPPLLKAHKNKINSRLIFKYQDDVLFKTHQAIAPKDNIYGQTCIQIWTVVNNYLHLTALGDTKTYIVSKDLDYVVDITAGIRSGDDPRDPGGRIGWYLQNGGADLRNYRHIFATLKQGDYVLSMSDGVDDNLQAKVLAIDSSDPDFGARVLQEILIDYKSTVNGYLNEDDINNAVMRHVRKVTRNRKLAMLSNENMEPEISAEFTGKLDHAGMIVYHHI